MFIYTIIVTYNGRKWVDFCLGSLYASTIKTIPIVVDNCSSDDTVEYIRKKYPDVIIFEQKQNLGFGQANNVGFRYALENNADYVLLLNQDAAIAANMIELCLAQGDGKSLLSPIHMNGDGSCIDNSFLDNSLTKCRELINDIFVDKVKKQYECGEICAACWLLPISVLKKIGGFNPLFFHYSEDNNYYHRLVYHQVSIRLVPNAYMYHDRKYYGNKAMFDEQWLMSGLLLNMTNINLTIFQRIIKFLSILKCCYFYKLPQCEYRIGDYFFNILRIIRKLKKIKHSRVLEMQEGPIHLYEKFL